mmetsp:Transcript_32171/g.91279  ORF Transcript_32171/g.91279 Transcript_32171/m.91279 type:complete len:269 (-) Transcript_32171:216-1022(-)|eukprot:CAMPEP_0117677818 /NCGR_PEP_ID=MMETSP0804-20121206/16946_1 /TAXON_ID=1074897 /ORGANISM="Tetraselmis astigmatica, Strain CCMP880" /LENGTH=268 /DNA_ID=CAMNT_0005487123 /DNA_START=151 /DNA_END=957 /DNA_ORIENTATION=+
MAAASRREEANAAKLVNVSLAKGNQAFQRGDMEEALKIFRSTDQLCDRTDAPPPVHAMVVRWYCDVLRKMATPELYAEGRQVMSKVVARCEEGENRPGIPKEIQRDLRGRMADLLAAWGELERDAGDFELSAQVLTKAVAVFKRMGEAYHFMAATQNRLAVTHIEAGDGEAALSALKRAQEFAESVPQHQDQLMQQTLCHRGSAYARLGDNDKAKEWYQKAHDMAHATGNEALVAELESRLELIEAEDGGATLEGQPTEAPASDDVFL